ncbi:MAG: hypothetical protein ACRDT1_16135, partial [Micromonosporaceae bacterium]
MAEPDNVAAAGDRQWLWALLPAFPVVLLVLRLWLLSRQNLQTMLLLAQHVSPVGLITALVTTLIWVLPAAILTVRALSALLLVSHPQSESRLAQQSRRMPGWVVWLAVLLGGLTWQVRFLPVLLMATLMITGLEARRRHGAGSLQRLLGALGIPIAAAVAAYLWLGPAIVQSFQAGEAVNGLLLLLPPGLAALLTGPVPVRAARTVIRGTAIGAAVISPVLIMMIFARAPVLPTVAMELDDPAACLMAGQELPQNSTCVVRGEVITVNDRTTALLRSDGTVLFVRNDAVRSQTLCASVEQAPTSRVSTYGLQ